MYWHTLRTSLYLACMDNFGFMAWTYAKRPAKRTRPIPHLFASLCEKAGLRTLNSKLTKIKHLDVDLLVLWVIWCYLKPCHPSSDAEAVRSSSATVEPTSTDINSLLTESLPLCVHILSKHFRAWNLILRPTCKLALEHALTMMWFGTSPGLVLQITF